MEECIYFKPQRADDKHRGCVRPSPCEQCKACAYLPPESATNKQPANKKQKGV
jgi:hypothetical protein